MTSTHKNIVFDPKVFLSQIGAGRTNAKYKPGDVIYAQGDAANSVFYLQKGKAKKAVTSQTGKEAVLSILETGDFFGEGCLHGLPRRMTTITAMTECAVMRLEKAAMLRVLHDESEFSELFILYLLQRNSRAEEDLVDHMFNSSEKRLARTLLLLANFGKDGRPEPVMPKISQETLAEMIGTTRSRVSFFMNKFRRLGFIDYRGGTCSDLQVHTSLLNMVLREGTEGAEK
jgi:CRP-like cAMP-binding protein